MLYNYENIDRVLFHETYFGTKNKVILKDITITVNNHESYFFNKNHWYLFEWDRPSKLLFYIVKRVYEPTGCGEDNTPISYTIDDITYKIEKRIIIWDSVKFPIFYEDLFNEMYNNVLGCKNKKLYLNFENDHDLMVKADFVPIINIKNVEIDGDLIEKYLIEDVFIRKL